MKFQEKRIPYVLCDLFSNPLSYISKVARQSGRTASPGGHHGGPRRATRRSHPDSPGSGAAPTHCPVAALMSATKRISDALFPRGFEVASPHRSLESTRRPSSCIRRSMYPRRKKFFPPLKRVFFSAAAEQQQTAADVQRQRNNSRRQPIPTQVFRPPGLGMRLRGSKGKRDKCS